jgi:hypothetical protein
MSMNETPPDTIVFIGDHDPSLWDLPWIDRTEITSAGEGRDDKKLVKLCVRRQDIWRRWGRKLAESGPRLGVDVRRRACGAASADIRGSVA